MTLGEAESRRDALLRGVGVLLKTPTLIYVVIGFALSFVVGSIIILAIGVDPAEAINTALRGSVTSRNGLANSLVFATPRLLVALGAAVAIRSGVFNLGGEGQLLMGAVGAAMVAVLLGPMFAPLHILLALIAAAVAGGLWASIAALLQVWRGADVLITSLLLSFVATFFVQYLVQGPFQQPGSVFSQSSRIADTAELPIVLPGTRLHLGFVIGLVMVGLVYLLLHRTTIGMEFRAAGFNPRAAVFSGMSPGRLVLTSMFVSGAIGGIAGALEIMGVQFRLLQGFSGGIGFEGIAIAFLGALKPLPILAVAIMFGMLQAGVIELQRLDVPGSMALIMEGLPILVLAAGGGIVLLRRGGGG